MRRLPNPKPVGGAEAGRTESGPGGAVAHRRARRPAPRGRGGAPAMRHPSCDRQRGGLGRGHGSGSCPRLIRARWSSSRMAVATPPSWPTPPTRRGSRFPRCLRPRSTRWPLCFPRQRHPESRRLRRRGRRGAGSRAARPRHRAGRPGHRRGRSSRALRRLFQDRHRRAGPARVRAPLWRWPRGETARQAR